MDIAAEYPNPGAVTIHRAHKGQGPTGWYGNAHNDAVGWYWLQPNRTDEGGYRYGSVYKRRQNAIDEAMRQFSNITGFREDKRFHIMIAEVG